MLRPTCDAPSIRRIALAAALLGASAIAPAASAGPARQAASPDANALPAQDIVLKVQSAAPNFSVEDVAGLPGRPIPLNIRLAGGGDKENGPGRLYLLTGIPEGVTLNLGGFLGDFWAVNSKILDKLAVKAPDDFTGAFTVRITQTGNAPGAARVASFTVTVGEVRGAHLPTAHSESTPAASAPNANERMLLTRAGALFRTGDVSGARVIFEFLASQGSSAAAIAMGETYDPLMLGKLSINGLQPDAEQARLWYQKAQELGDLESTRRSGGLATR